MTVVDGTLHARSSQRVKRMPSRSSAQRVRRWWPVAVGVVIAASWPVLAHVPALSSPRPSELPLHQQFAAELLLVALLVWGLTLVWNAVLQWQVRLRTAALQRATEDRVALLEAIPDLLFEVDRQGRYLHIHTLSPELLSQPAEQLLGRTVSEVMPPEAAAICLEALAEADAQGRSHGRQIRLRLPTGEHWFELSVACRSTAPDQPQRFVVLSREVSERRQLADQLQRQNRFYASLSRCNQVILTGTDPEDLLHDLCAEAIHSGELKMAWVGLVTEDGSGIRPVAFAGEGTGYLQGIRITLSAENPSGRGPTGTAVRENRPVWCQDFQHDPATRPWHERSRRYGWCSSAAIPLRQQGRVIGALTLYAGEPGAFDATIQRLLLDLGASISLALERVQADTLRRQLAAAIAASERNYRELTESIHDVIWKLDPETLTFLYVSPAVRRLRGLEPSVVMAESLSESLLPESRDWLVRLQCWYDRCRQQGGPEPGDILLEEVAQYARDGSTVWSEVSVSLVENPETGQLEFHGVSRDITERKQAEARMAQLVSLDPLTGLPNRSMLRTQSAALFEPTQGQPRPLALMLLGLDNFKGVNESLGYEQGDRLLVEMARRLRQLLRSSDLVARTGGDEFLLVLPDLTQEQAIRMASRILEEVSRPWSVGSQNWVLTASLGIALSPDDGTDLDTLFLKADTAMYQVKRESPNGFRFFTEQMQRDAVRAVTVANALHQAIEQEQFELHYQPQVELRTGQVIGAEVLLRWTHPQLGMISPSEFIPLAESNGLILEIGTWVLCAALTQARIWQEQGAPPLRLAVNLSALQFRNPGLADRVQELLAATGILPQSLELELTESMTMQDPEAAGRIMRQLTDLGLHLSIDDFGTGYSSLSYLQRFPVQTLKIDQSFVRDLDTKADDRAIITAIIGLARTLGIRTLAEGVETREQLTFLAQQGCDVVQGYFFSRPVCAAELSLYLEQQHPLRLQAWQLSPA